MLPEYVVILYVTVTLVPVVFWLAHDSGGVKEKLVELDLLAIVVDALPQVAVIVCVKLLDFLVIVKVCAVPSVPFATVSVDFLGIVVSVTLSPQ